MIGYPNQKELLKQFSKNSKIAGVIFLIIGLAGMFFPAFLSIATAYFVAWMLILSALMAGYHTYKIDKKDWLGWLKAFVFGLTGILIALNPLPGVAALGIILAIFFFFDGFSSFALAFELKPQKWWWLSLLNGVLSVILAIIILVGWPFSSLWIVGFFVGISLFFDGLVLLSLSSYAKKMDEENN